MGFFDYFSFFSTKGYSRSSKKKRSKFFYIRWAITAVAVVGLFYACSRCRTDEKRLVERISPDVSDFSVVFINGEATLYWVDSTDYNLDHMEILWTPGSEEPVSVARGIGTYVIPGLVEGKEYTVTVTAVDKWKNRSDLIEGGAGTVFKQRTEGGIKGTPVAEQVTLSWTNFADSAYDYIEITADQWFEGLDRKTPVRIPKGVESKTLTGLTNDLEHTFYVQAVDSQGNRTPINELGLFVSDRPTAPESIIGRSSAGQIIVTWEDPSHPQFNNIEIVYSPRGETPVTVAKGEQTRAFSGFSDINDYEFTVYAVDTAGRRRPLTNVKLLTPQIPLFNGRDAEKMVVQGIPATGQAILKWENFQFADLDHITIMYTPVRYPEFEYKQDAALLSGRVSVGKESESAIITGLSDQQDYFFLAYGVDTEDNKRVITGLQFSRPQIPEFITYPVAGKVTLVWTDPEDANLEYIEVRYVGMDEQPVRVSKGVGSYTFSNLYDKIEYEFKITAVAQVNIYAVATANVIVTRLPVLTGVPVSRQLSIAWTDPADLNNVEHIEIIYSPGSGRPQTIAKGIESRTFTNLVNGTEYTFIIYARDSIGNRHPVRSPRFYDPRTAFASHPEPASHAETREIRPLNWRLITNTTFDDSAIFALAYGIAANGTARWVAGGNEGKIAYSNDYGLNWLRANDSTFGNYAINAIGYGNGHWVAVGKGGKMAWSANAAIWYGIRKINFTANYSINAVAYGDRRWIAVGSEGSIMLSDDNGASWRLIEADIFERSDVNTIAYHGGRWIAGGAGGKMAWSDDNGLSWTAVANSSFGNSSVNVLVYDRGRWLAAGYAQRIAWSEDSITWQSLPRPFYILCIGYNGARWVVGGQEGRMAWSSDGGNNWIVDDHGHSFFGTDWVQAVAFGRAANGGGRWLSAGQNGKIIYADE